MGSRRHAALWHCHEGGEPLPCGTGGHCSPPGLPVVACVCTLGAAAAARRPSVGAVHSRGSPASRAERARLWRRHRAKDILEAVSLPQCRVRREGSPPAAHHAVLRDVVDEFGREEVRAALVQRGEAALDFRDMQESALRHRRRENQSSATPQVFVTDLSGSATLPATLT